MNWGRKIYIAFLFMGTLGSNVQAGQYSLFQRIGNCVRQTYATYCAPVDQYITNNTQLFVKEYLWVFPLLFPLKSIVETIRQNRIYQSSLQNLSNRAHEAEGQSKRAYAEAALIKDRAEAHFENATVQELKPTDTAEKIANTYLAADRELQEEFEKMRLLEKLGTFTSQIALQSRQIRQLRQEAVDAITFLHHVRSNKNQILKHFLTIDIDNNYFGSFGDIFIWLGLIVLCGDYNQYSKFTMTQHFAPGYATCAKQFFLWGLLLKASTTVSYAIDKWLLQRHNAARY